MSLEKRTALIERYRARRTIFGEDGKVAAPEFAGFALFEHECHWGPSFAIRHGELGSGGVRVEAEMCRVPRPRLVCAHGFLATGNGSRS